MSNIPEVDTNKVISRYAAKVSELQMQLFQVESVAESLLAERDEAVDRVAELEEKEAQSDDSVKKD